jgi:hypothetical protein
LGEEVPRTHEWRSATRWSIPGRTVAASLAVLSALSLPAANALAVTARSAGTVSLNETGQLHKTSGHGITINQTLDEAGSATGTVKGMIYIHLKFPAYGRVSAEVNIYPRGSSITGTATATYHSSGASASFTGTMNVIRGTGAYAHAHGSGLSFTGTVQRSNDAVTVHLSGHMST